jgi:hypothetical protein
VTEEDLAANYPRIYHVAARGSWDSICRHGLLCTSALLDLFGMTGEARRQLEEKHRPELVTITHPTYGAAVIRDQKPMSDSGLRRALINATPKRWYKLLNGKVFFWLTEERLDRFLSARAYRSQAHCVITIDTRLLLKKFSRSVWLSPINSGCTKPYPHKRGMNLFKKIVSYPFDARRKYGLQNAIAELAIDNHVSGIKTIALQAEERGANRVSRVFWER